ncbi:hypothetical protein GQ53DRAFT_735511 [Thozetella sp. PMI_491]|nr:hypothetical protein GQ53DRAFT_735511 [Thozetella sp. PMI_491]
MRPSVRLSVVLWLFVFVAFLVYFISHVATFVKIFTAHSGITITQEEMLDAYRKGGSSRVQHVPKIIHQVFHNWKDPNNDTLPDDWARVRQDCINKNPDYDFKVWTEKSSRDFIETEYPWFLKTYDRYSFKVQRVDAVRYFLLFHFGGIYVDLDNGCLGSLDPLLYYPVWVTDGARGALSNNILAARPHHPYYALMTQQLIPYNYHYILPYPTIHYASGQWYETAIWEMYHSMLPRPEENPAIEHRLYRLIMDNRDTADPWIYFTQERGGTWNHWDNLVFMFIGDHLFLFLLTIFSIIGAAGWLALKLVRKYRGEGYTRLRNQPDRHAV